MSADRMRLPLPSGRLCCATNIPPVALTSFKTFGKEVPLSRDISVLDTVILAPFRQLLLVHLQCPRLHEPGKKPVRLPLGVDRDWVQSGYRRFVSYTNLDPDLPSPGKGIQQ
jgi:hypothetical protein